MRTIRGWGDLSEFAAGVNSLRQRWLMRGEPILRSKTAVVGSAGPRNRSRRFSMRAVLIVGAMGFSMATTISQGADMTVSVDGRSGPWDIALNPALPYGVAVDGKADSHLGPTHVKNSDALPFAAGETLKIEYVSGRPLAGGNGTVFGSGGAGVPGWPPNVAPCTEAPGCYTGERITRLMQLLGAFADANGKVVGTPFVVGNSREVTVPAGASQLLLGFNDGWYNDNGSSILVKVTNPCIPTGEQTNFVRWVASVADFVQVLNGPSGHSFAGAYVREVDVGGSMDTCWFPQSKIPVFTGISGGTWVVEAGNIWGPDRVGSYPEVMDYYRKEGRAPCFVLGNQQMQIQCTPGGPFHNYGPINKIYLGISARSVSSGRAGNNVSRRF